MPIKITMPALSPTMEEGKLAKWLKSEGDMVEPGDVIAEIETDKATMEVEAADEGRLAKILVSEGTGGVPVNDTIAVLLEEDEDESTLEGFLEEQNKGDQEKSQVEVPKKQEAVESSTMPQKEKNRTNGKDKGERIFASPLARRLAEQAGIDLSDITGSGPRGRIVKADVEKVKEEGVPVSAGKAAPPAVAKPGVSSGIDAKKLADQLGIEYEERPNNNIRKITAQRLQESKQTVPHFYLTIECRIDKLLQARKQINEEANGEFKLSVNDFIVKACANALRAYPAANAAWTDEAILQYKHADISVAVATDNGLITPIVKEAENKGLRQISEEIKDLAGRARENRLKPEEFQGGTFTVSNLGMYGIKEFGAIINPPQACILAVGAGGKKPYIEDDDVKIGTFMACTLSVDHRAVDGAVGAEFLQILKQYLENPLAMLL